MRLQFWSQTAAAVLLLALISSGCGGTHHNNADTREVRGIVLQGNTEAIANPNGADGLVPVGAGVTVTEKHSADSIDDTSLFSIAANDQGRFSTRIHNDQYYFYLKDTCATVPVAGYDYESNGVLATYASSVFYYRDGTDAMKQKAALAATALGVDVVVLVNTDLRTDTYSL